ncbi:uncharacterized protein CDV56_109401 [Aspergillus thermomutatus]|uniref:RNase H type-1 domain-containing protein n=1 Tax=Aspergillus thermomutatus TaxID=41047 RepID=A0A397HQ85_ASPTH|nr:uncharacterized protein CDV56_109401 [Aspergillus thermomutatus]RHZ65359.1 hypothetical protein CDV56_109401 [Aspergillus thermomutatus]
MVVHVSGFAYYKWPSAATRDRDYVPEESVEADRRRDDDDYYPGTVVIQPGKYTPGTGQVIPKKFTPPSPSTRPQDLFPPGRREDTSPPVRRFISRLNRNEMLIYTDGACLGNGQANPRAGCGVVFREERPGRRGHFAFPLELQGLRGVDEGCYRDGLGSVKNQDLWKCLLGWCEDAATFRAKTKLEFWRIPREWNAEADGWAKLAAASDVRATAFGKPSGLTI